MFTDLLTADQIDYFASRDVMNVNTQKQNMFLCNP